VWVDREALPGDAPENELDAELLAKAGGCKRSQHVTASADAEHQGLAGVSQGFRNV